jgi:hypothetical protein
VGVAVVALPVRRVNGDIRHHAKPDKLMLSMREITPEGFGPKARDWNSPELLEHWREEWAHHQNRALERAGRTERVDHRSLEARGIDREPEPKQGPVATQMEREGRPSKAGDDRRAAKERNQQREELKAEAEIIDFEIAQIERQEREAPPPGLPLAVVNRQKGRFEVWANARRADLQNARLDAEGWQGRLHTEQRRELEQRHEGFYGPQLDALNAEAAAIKTRQRQGGGLRGLAYRVTGRAARDRQRADEVTAGIANIEQRKTEQHEALTARQNIQTARFTARYAEAGSKLEQRIEQRRAAREAEGWTPPEARQTGQEIRQPPDIDREAGKTPTEGREARTGETTPENEQAPTAQPEAAQEGNSEQGQEAKPWTPEERAAAIERERQRQEQADRERGSNDNDRGREIE